MSLWKNKRVLVAGGAGFIGSHTVDALIAAGARVSVVDNLSTGRREFVHPRARFARLDIGSPRLAKIFAKEKPEIVFMFAAIPRVAETIKYPQKDAREIRKFWIKHIFAFNQIPHSPRPDRLFGSFGFHS